MTTRTDPGAGQAICAVCEGGGLMIVGWNDDAYENAEGPCDGCGGTGRVHAISPDTLAFVRALIAAGVKMERRVACKLFTERADVPLGDWEDFHAALAHPAIRALSEADS